MKKKSFWLNTFKVKSFNKLNEDIDVDICIVGGGLTGITTAKITSQHGIFYKYLTDSKGKKFATKYLEANENAIKNIKNIIDLENIECDFERKNAYVFTEDISNVEKIKDEVDVIKKRENINIFSLFLEATTKSEQLTKSVK